jgi:hypothetical protein
MNELCATMSQAGITTDAYVMSKLLPAMISATISKVLL